MLELLALLFMIVIAVFTFAILVAIGVVAIGALIAFVWLALQMLVWIVEAAVWLWRQAVQ